MKNLKFLFFGALIVSLLFSCRKYERDEIPDENKPEDKIGVSIGGQKAFILNDTVWAEVNFPVLFWADPSGLSVTSWLWSFDGGASVSSIDQATYEFYSTGPHSLHLVAFYGVNQSTFRDIPIMVVEDISQLDPVRLVSSQSLGGGVYNVVFAIAKSRTRWITGTNTFFYTGNMTSPIWTNQIVPSYDTSYNLVGSPPVLIPPQVGDNGFFYALKNLNSPAGEYDLGTGKVKNGQYLWLNFSGSAWVHPANPTMVKYKVLPNGSVVPNVTIQADLPGMIGDIGNNPILRFDLLSDRAVIYFHNSAAYNGQQFYRVYDQNNLGGDPILQSPVNDFPEWGKTEISYSSPLIQTEGLLVLKFGESIYAPCSYNPNTSYSSYYDKVSWCLRIFIRQVKAINQEGKEETVPQLRTRE